MTELQPLYDKKCECMMCKTKFTTKKLRSRFVVVKSYDTDFAPTYENIENDPNLYFVAVCPKCGFSFTDDFAPYFPPGSKEIIDSKIAQQWLPRSFGEVRTNQVAAKTIKLAAYCGTLKKEKHVSIAGLFMRLAWIYRALLDHEQEQRFMKLAVDEYMEAYISDDYRGTQMTELRLLYMIAELSRRTGQVDQSVKYFSKVIEKQGSFNEAKIVEMARDRWQEIREEQKTKI